MTARRRLLIALSGAVLGACAPQPRVSPAALPTSTTTTVVAHQLPEGPVEGPASATITLDATQRAGLGLPPAGAGVEAGDLSSLSEDQWAEPGVVAGRFALVRSNYRIDDDPAALRQRLAPYVVERLAEDLATSSGGGAGLAELRASGAVFRGDVLGLVTTERSESRSVVDLTLRRSTDGDNRPPRVEFWRLTLVLDRIAGHWLVVDVETS